jgi:hypothetical protein
MKSAVTAFFCVCLMGFAAFAAAETPASEVAPGVFQDGLYMFQRTVPAQWPLDAAIAGKFEYPVIGNQIPAGVLGYMKNSGGSLPSNYGHIIGTFGLAEDTQFGTYDLYGVEGRVNSYGNSNIYGVLGLATHQGSTFKDRFACGMQGRVEITADGSAPLNQGIATAFYAPSIIGGATKYSFFGKDPLRIDNALFVYNNSASNYLSLANDGLGSLIKTNIGNLSLETPQGEVRTGKLHVLGAICAEVTDTGCTPGPGVIKGNFASPDNSAGMTTVVTVRDGGGKQDCTMTFKSGLLTATTCKHK